MSLKSLGAKVAAGAVEWATPIGWMFGGVWDFLRSIPWQVYAAAALIVAFVVVDRRAEHRGITKANTAWEKKVADIRADYAEADRKAAAKRHRDRGRIDAASTRTIQSTRDYYADHPADRDAVCLPAERVQDIRAARGETAAIAGSPGGGEADANP